MDGNLTVSQASRVAAIGDNGARKLAATKALLCEQKHPQVESVDERLQEEKTNSVTGVVLSSAASREAARQARMRRRGLRSEGRGLAHHHPVPSPPPQASPQTSSKCL